MKTVIATGTTTSMDAETQFLPIPGKPSELMRLALLCSPTVIASLELKILARLCLECSEQPELADTAPTFAFLAANLAGIALRLNKLDDIDGSAGGMN
jgi:hypothetical protein